MEKVKFSFFALVVAIFLTSCGNNSFSVEGQVVDAQGDTLWFEHFDLHKIVVLDSVPLTANGNYKFSLPAPHFPDFYRLRLGDQTLIFAVDSCEKIKISASKNGFSTDFSVENSPNTDKIRQLRLSSFELQKAISTSSAEELTEKIENHKHLARKIILENPASTAAYYAVNQTIGGRFFFSPYEKSDLPYWAAVATAYKINFPTYKRSIFLENCVLAARQQRRNDLNTSDFERMLADTQPVGNLDILLPDANENLVSLASQKGKVVLLDFSLLNMPNSSEHILALREIYNRFENQGFTIFQVAFDSNKLAWQGKTQNLPWISVRDEKANGSNYLILYNLQTLPTSFLLNKNGDIVARLETLENASEQIAKLLK